MKRLFALGLFAAFLALPALAGDRQIQSAKVDKSTNLSSGDFLLGPTVNYTDKLGVGGAFGYTWHKEGITLLGEIAAVQLKGENGTTDFRRYCTTYHVPFSVGDRTQAEFKVGVLFTLKKYK